MEDMEKADKIIVDETTAAMIKLNKTYEYLVEFTSHPHDLSIGVVSALHKEAGEILKSLKG